MALSLEELQAKYGQSSQTSTQTPTTWSPKDRASFIQSLDAQVEKPEGQDYWDKLAAPTEISQQKDKGFLTNLSEVVPNLAIGASKGALSTIKGASSLGEKVLLKPIEKVFGTEKKVAELTGTPEGMTTAEKLIPQGLTEAEGTVQKAGKGIEQVAELFTPAGIEKAAATTALKLPKMLGVGLKSLAGAFEFGAKTAVQSGGDIEKTKEASIAGAIPVGEALALGGKLLGAAAKTGKSIMTGAGELLTGVGKDKLTSWYNLAKSNPQKAEAIKTLVAENPTQPFLGLAKVVKDKLSTLKEEAQTVWKTAKETFDQQYPGQVFDLSSKVSELKPTLNKFGLTLRQAKDEAGKLTNNFIVGATGKISRFTDQELSNIQNLVNTLRKGKDLSTDDLTAIRSVFDNAYDAIKYGNDFKPKAYHALVSSLKDDAEQFIEGVLPEGLKEANKLYKNYYDAYKNIGNKVVDASGEVKNGAETWLGNLMNLNKGAEREKVYEASKKLGIDLLDASKNIKTAKELSELVPNSTKNRTMDFIRAIVTKAGIPTGIYGASTGNVALAVPAVLLNVLSSPKIYGNLIEGIAGASNKVNVQQFINKLTPEEIQGIANVVRGVYSQSK